MPKLTARRRTIGAIVLLILTFLSATFAGALQAAPPDAGQDSNEGMWGTLRHLWLGLPFSLPLCAILISHEAGHYIAARVHGVRTSLPYFIPFPLSPIGTLGAVIGLREQVRDRNTLFDIAASGPIAGLLIAIPFIFIGLTRSPVGPVQIGDIIEGQSLLYMGIKLLSKGAILPGTIGGTLQDVKLHPMAFAGWVGLLLTMINLLPIGQLDGGHVSAAFFGDDNERRSRIAHRALLGLAGLSFLLVAAISRAGQGRPPLRECAAHGLRAALPWFLFAGILLLLRRLSGGIWHYRMDPRPLSPLRLRLCYGLLVLLGLLFMPYLVREAT